MSKMVKQLFFIAITAIALCSCEKVEDENLSTNTEVLDINIETTLTENSITLKWVQVEGCSWYFISHGIVGGEMSEEDAYQDVNRDTLSFTLRSLDSNTVYQIKMEGKDYLSGGELLASKTLTASTK